MFESETPKARLVWFDAIKENVDMKMKRQYVAEFVVVLSVLVASVIECTDRTFLDVEGLWLWAEKRTTCGHRVVHRFDSLWHLLSFTSDRLLHGKAWALRSACVMSTHYAVTPHNETCLNMFIRSKIRCKTGHATYNGSWLGFAIKTSRELPLPKK